MSANDKRSPMNGSLMVIIVIVMIIIDYIESNRPQQVK